MRIERLATQRWARVLAAEGWSGVTVRLAVAPMLTIQVPRQVRGIVSGLED